MNELRARKPCIENSRQHQGFSLTFLVPVTIALRDWNSFAFSSKIFSLLKSVKLKRMSSYFPFPRTILSLIYISFLAARLSGTCACCNSVNKNNLQFSGRTFIYKQSVGDLTLAIFLKHGIIPQKRQVFHYKYSKTPHWRFQKNAKS